MLVSFVLNHWGLKWNYLNVVTGPVLDFWIILRVGFEAFILLNVIHITYYIMQIVLGGCVLRLILYNSSSPFFIYLFTLLFICFSFIKDVSQHQDYCCNVMEWQLTSNLSPPPACDLCKKKIGWTKFAVEICFELIFILSDLDHSICISIS